MGFVSKIKRGFNYFKRNGLLQSLRRLSQKIFNASATKAQKQEQKDYLEWLKNNEPSKEELELQRKHKFEYMPKISVIVPMYNTPEKYLRELIDSLVNQTYSNFELCLADGSESKKDYVQVLVSSDKRIKYKFLNENKGISENSNEAIKLATGDYIALLDHDDVLPLHALYEIVKVINEDSKAEFIYTDEDKLMENLENRLGPHFKPDFAPDTLRSYNYICHFSIFKKSLMDRLDGFNKEFDGSQDYDIILRATEQANKIVHIPNLLYKWRMNEKSVALNSAAKPYAYEAAKRAISASLKRQNIDAEVIDSNILGLYRVIYKVHGNPKVSIIIPNKNHYKDLKRCIDSIGKSTYKNYEIVIVENNSTDRDIFDYYDELKKNDNIKIETCNLDKFNFSKLINYGVEKSSGEYVILLNNDIKIITNDWIEILLGASQRDDIGAVGAKLLYKNGAIQHAGVVLNLTGTAGHVNLFAKPEEIGYMGRIMIQQNFSAITGALMMVSRKNFESVNGMDEKLSVAYNDVDLCLKLRKKNKVILYDPYVQAYHFESSSRGYEDSDEKKSRLESESNYLKEKWKEEFSRPDPYFNVNFRKDVPKITINSQKTEKVVNL